MSESARPRRRLVWTAGLLLLLALAGVLAACGHSSSGRGARSAQTAATLFVGAADTGSGSGTAAMSCTGFADQAHSIARSGADPGITFSLGAVITTGDTATAVMDEALNVAGSVQHQQYTLALQRTGGLWLVCGEH